MYPSLYALDGKDVWRRGIARYLFRFNHGDSDSTVPVRYFILLLVLWLNVAVKGGAVAYSVHLLDSGTLRIMKIDQDRTFMFASSILTVALCKLVGMSAASVIAWSYLVPLVYLP